MSATPHSQYRHCLIAMFVEQSELPAAAERDASVATTAEASWMGTCAMTCSSFECELLTTSLDLRLDIQLQLYPYMFSSPSSTPRRRLTPGAEQLLR